VSGSEEPHLEPPCPATAVVPCYNAGDRVRPVLEQLVARVRQTIVVDDGSTDGCLEGAERLGARVVRLPENRGKGHAIRAGLEAALEDPAEGPIVLLDADGQHDPAELPRLVAAFEAEPTDLLVGARVFEGSTVPWASRFGNRATIRIASWLAGRDLPDTQCGYRVLSRDFARAVLDRVPGGRYETEMAMLLLAIGEGRTLRFVPIATLYEEGNASSHFRKIRDSWRIYTQLWRSWRRRG